MLEMNIPPLISRSPPPLPSDDDAEDEDEDEFGHYVGDFVENGSSRIFHSIDVETLPTELGDFIRPGKSECSVKENGEVITVFKCYQNSIDVPCTKDQCTAEISSLKSDASSPNILSCDNSLSTPPSTTYLEDETSGNNDCVCDVGNEEDAFQEDHDGQNCEDINLPCGSSLPYSQALDESKQIADMGCFGTEDVKKGDDDFNSVDASKEVQDHLFYEEASGKKESDAEIVPVLTATDSFEDFAGFHSELPTVSEKETQVTEDISSFTKVESSESVDYEKNVVFEYEPQFQDDDEFSDFADFQTSEVTEATWPQPESSIVDNVHNDSIDDDSCYGQDFEFPPLEGIKTNPVWTYLQFLDDTPALKYQWISSTSNHKLLSALKIDSRNIFCGPWNRSAKCLGSDFGQPKSTAYHDSAGIPNLGEMQHHSSCHIFREPSSEVCTKAPVPDAHFDWEGSGLVNPLFSASKEDPVVQCNIEGVLNIGSSPISGEAQEILKFLPDLSYMTKTYLMFRKLSSTP